MSDVHDEQHEVAIALGWLFIYGGTALAALILVVLVLLGRGQ